MQENMNNEAIERRKFVRLNIACDINYKVLDVEPPQGDKTKTRNISSGGICLIANEKISSGSILELNFSLPDKKPIIKSKGRVAWIKPFKIASEEEHFDCGVEFTEIEGADRKRINQYVFTYK